jgi:hypothetical protein
MTTRIIEQTRDRFRGTHKGADIESGSAFTISIERDRVLHVTTIERWMDDAKREARRLVDINYQ